MSRITPAAIEIIIGPVYSGKTEELTRRVLRAKAAGHKVQVFYPQAATPSQTETDSKRHGLRINDEIALEATSVQAADQIASLLENDTSIVAIDEIQFFDRHLARICSTLAHEGRRVIVAGLDRNFRGEPFEAVFDMITPLRLDRLRARCSVCGMPADYSQRIVDGKSAPVDSPLFLTGGRELYEPRCKDHYSSQTHHSESEDASEPMPFGPLDHLPGVVNVTQQLNHWTDRLQAIARTGLGYKLEPSELQRFYDEERYEELLRLAAEMRAFIRDHEALFDKELQEEIYRDWRAQVQPGQRGYVTPKIAVSGAVFHERGEILLARRSQSSYWDLPTGWCEVGHSAAENTIKEVMEETKLRTTPICLVGVYDSQRWGFQSETHLYSLVFYCHLDGGSLQLDPLEIAELAFFAEHELPLLLAGVRIGIQHSFEVHRRERQEAYFDLVDGTRQDFARRAPELD
jgi:thymidine kinase